jgi:hypothetical protein
MATLKKALDDIAARFANEVLAALTRASVEELQGALPNGKGTRSRTRIGPGRSQRTSTTGHALEIMAANLVRHLKDHGPTRSEELRRALGISRQDMVKVVALATEWKVMGKKGEKRSTTYYATKTPGPKPQITLGDRMRVAAVTGR